MAEVDKGKIVIRSSKSEIVNFRNSILAKDMRRELLIWARVAKSAYPEVDNLLEKGRIDGRLEALDYVLGLPDNMIEVLEEREREIKEEEEEDGDRRNETDTD